MATNYLSASLLSDTYGTMLTADDRENERKILYAFENARVSGSQITPNNLLRDDNGLLLSFSDSENNATEYYWQLKRIPNTKPKIVSGNINSVLKEKRVFSEFQKSEPTPEPSTLSDLEKTLQEKIKLYEELIADAQGED